MSYLYKRSNFLWHLLIKSDLVHAVWRPLVELTRLRHLRFRTELEKRAVSPEESSASNGAESGIKIGARRPVSSGVVVSAGV
jgi:hypothetical protein